MFISIGVLVFLFAAAILMIAKAWAIVYRTNLRMNRTFFGRPIKPQPTNPFKPDAKL